MIFLDNKYTRWYYNIIDHRKKNIFEGYTERHHITPRSLNGSDDFDNLVDLSAREHFICHLLLRKMTTGNDKRKMTIAIGAMMMQNGNERYVCNSYMYEKYKKIFLEEQSKLMKEKWSDGDWREDLLKKYRELWKDPSYRKRRTDRMRELWYDPVLSSKRIQAWETSGRRSLWDSEKSKEVNKKLWSNPEHRKLRSEQHTQWANKMRTCDNCGQTVKNGIYSFHHGKRCKFNKDHSLEDFFS